MKDRKGCSVSDQTQPPVQRNFQDDGLDLVDCFLVLIRHKLLILLGSLAPALIVGVVLFVQPRDYWASYTYRMALSETDLKVLKELFYSAENIAKLIDTLGEHGLDDKTRASVASQLNEDPSRVISFQVVPSFANAKTRSFEELRQSRSTKGSLLILKVQTSLTAMERIATICRTNFEQVLPTYREKEELVSKIVGLKTNVAEIEESRYILNLQLQRKMSTLTKLRQAMPDAFDKPAGDVILQLDIGSGGSDYLPLPYQIQAAQTQVIHLEEAIRTNVEKYAYYADLLSVNEALLEPLTTTSGKSFTLDRFHALLTEELASHTGETEHVRDYLAAYMKRIENQMAVTTPVVKNPAIHAVARGIVKRTGLVFALACLLSIFAAFLREGLWRRRWFAGQD